MIELSTHWEIVHLEAKRLKDKTIKQLFDADPNRFENCSVKLDDLLLDFSKENVDKKALDSLMSLAKSTGVEAFRDSMFSGVKINNTEKRSVLHMALRDGAGDEVMVDGEDIMPDVRSVRDRFLAFAESVRSGEYQSSVNMRFTDIVSIGIGGSDLGPAMVTAALSPWHDGPRIHFVSNVDGAHLSDVLAVLDQRKTLVIVSSKTFTTLETMTNARTARAWLVDILGEDNVGTHLAAVSTNLVATQAFGIDDSRVFGFWDWVGGRYSVWSAIGLPVAIAIGRQKFCEFLKGAHEMDQHFKTAPIEENLPIMFALIGIWRRNEQGMTNQALMPYDHRLSRFPAFIQQLDMESNGKRTSSDGTPVKTSTGSVIWGEAGTNAQHSFFQLLHQGTDITPVDFIVAAQILEVDGMKDSWRSKHHDLLIANALAQANALAFGLSKEDVIKELRKEGMPEDEIYRVAPHRTFPGNRPSTMITYRHLTPKTLGRIIALYEHKVFTQGVIWGINSYDQWGVELGKKLANNIAPAVSNPNLEKNFDLSTIGLLNHIHSCRL